MELSFWQIWPLDFALLGWSLLMARRSLVRLSPAAQQRIRSQRAARCAVVLCAAGAVPAGWWLSGLTGGLAGLTLLFWAAGLAALPGLVRTPPRLRPAHLPEPRWMEFHWELRGRSLWWSRRSGSHGALHWAPTGLVIRTVIPAEDLSLPLAGWWSGGWWSAAGSSGRWDQVHWEPMLETLMRTGAFERSSVSLGRSRPAQASSSGSVPQPAHSGRQRSSRP